MVAGQLRDLRQRDHRYVIGFIDDVQDDGIVWLNVADKVEIRVTKGAIASRMSTVESRDPQAG